MDSCGIKIACSILKGSGMRRGRKDEPKGGEEEVKKSREIDD